MSGAGDPLAADAAARQAALDPRRSWLLTAPAGAGKTALLIQRYLALLATCGQPEQVLVITSTAQAADAVRMRVLAALADADTREAPPTAADTDALRRLARAVAARDAAMDWSLAQTPGRLRIQPVDALCLDLAAQRPVAARLGWPVRLTERPEPLYQQAAAALLDRWARASSTTLAAGEAAPEATLLREVDADRERATALLAWRLASRDCRLHPHDSPPPLRRTGVQGQLAEALEALLPRAVAQLRLLFNARGEIDAIEAAQAALRTVHAGGDDGEADGGDGDLHTAAALPPHQATPTPHSPLRHVLVDDFQDAPPHLTDLLAALTAGWAPGDGRTLLLVGDPMASVDRAPVAGPPGLHTVAQRGIGSLRPPRLRLRANYRARPSLVEWTHACLAPLFDADADGRGVAGDSPARAVPVPARAAADARVVPVTLTLDSTGSADGQARAVAACVAGALDDGAVRVAVLAQAPEQLGQVLPALRAAGLRYRGVDVEPLRDAPEVRDVHTLMRALWHLGDRAAWLAVLRAPWCGLSLADLHALVRDDRGRTVWESIIDQRARDRLSHDGRRRLSRVKGVVADAWAQRGRAPLRDWVEGTWSALGGAATLSDLHALRNVEGYFELLEAHDDAGRLADLERLEGDLACRYAAPDPRADGRVTVMTIHRARGVEFDVVVLPALGTPAKALSRAPFAAAEARCLAYVALTRARERLHLFGELRRDGDGATVAPDSLLALLEPGLRATGLWGDAGSAGGPLRSAAPDAAPDLAAAAAQAAPSKPERRLLERLPPDWALPLVPVPEVVRVARPSLVDEPPLMPAEGIGEIARHVGRVTHWILTRVAGRSAELARAGETAVLSRRVVGALHRAGLRGNALLQAARQTVQAVQGTLADERGRWVLADHPGGVRAGSALSGWLNGRLVSLRLDITFVDSAGTRWLIDLPSAAPPDGDVEALVAAQIAACRETLAQAVRLLRMEDARPVRVGLYFPRLQLWREITGAVEEDAGAAQR